MGKDDIKVHRIEEWYDKINETIFKVNLINYPHTHSGIRNKIDLMLEDMINGEDTNGPDGGFIGACEDYGSDDFRNLITDLREVYISYKALPKEKKEDIVFARLLRDETQATVALVKVLYIIENPEELEKLKELDPAKERDDLTNFDYQIIQCLRRAVEVYKKIINTPHAKTLEVSQLFYEIPKYCKLISKATGIPLSISEEKKQ